MQLLNLLGAMGTKETMKLIKHQRRHINTKRTMKTNRSTSAYALMAPIAAAGPVEGWEGQAGAERTRTYRLRPAKACRSLPGPAVACQGLPGPARACQLLAEPAKKSKAQKSKKAEKQRKHKKTKKHKKAQTASRLKPRTKSGNLDIF